jgi:hypothetical protein
MELSAFKSAFSLSEQNKRDVEEEIDRLKREWYAERHDLDNQIIALKVAIEELILRTSRLTLSCRVPNVESYV